MKLIETTWEQRRARLIASNDRRIEDTKTKIKEKEEWYRRMELYLNHKHVEIELLKIRLQELEEWTPLERPDNCMFRRLDLVRIKNKVFLKDGTEVPKECRVGIIRTFDKKYVHVDVRVKVDGKTEYLDIKRIPANLEDMILEKSVCRKNYLEGLSFKRSIAARETRSSKKR